MNVIELIIAIRKAPTNENLIHKANARITCLRKQAQTARSKRDIDALERAIAYRGTDTNLSRYWRQWRFDNLC